MRSIISSLEDAVLRTRSLTERQIADLLFDRRRLTVSEDDSTCLYFFFDTSHPKKVITYYDVDSDNYEYQDIPPGTTQYSVWLDGIPTEKKQLANESILFSTSSSLERPDVNSMRSTLLLIVEDFKSRVEDLMSYGWTPTSFNRFGYGDLQIVLQTRLSDQWTGSIVSLSSYVEEDSLYPQVSYEYSIRDSLVRLFQKRLTLDTLPLLPPLTRDLLVKTGNHS